MTRTTKVDAFAFSQERYGLDILKRHSPLSRTGKKRHPMKSTSPLYSSAIFQQKIEVPQRDDFEKAKFDEIFEKTASILSGMREECKVLRQERISSNANTKKPYPN